MSPASQGNLDVEHYTGSNLISSSARISQKGKKFDSNALKNNKSQVQKLGPQHKCKDQFHRHPPTQGYSAPNIVQVCECGNGYKYGPRPNQYNHPGGNWTGMPLISMASGGRKNKKYTENGSNIRNPQQNLKQRNNGGPTAEEDATFRTPLSRLAIHTQGAPLILSGRYSNSNRKNNNRLAPIRNNRGDLIIRRSNKYKDNHSNGISSTSDSLSVASDESSGSGHSENCLPRIIKPRKRRKKDRKPVGTNNEPAKAEEIDEQSNSSVTKPYIPLCYESFNSTKNDTKSTPVIPRFKKHPVQTYHVYQKTKDVGQPSLDEPNIKEDASEDELHDPSLDHNFEDVSANDEQTESASSTCSPSSCQCRYCDPAGIWDSPGDPFLTPPPLSSDVLYPKLPLSNNAPVFLTPPPDTKSFHFLFDYPSVNERQHAELMLRRSWSEPTQSRHSQEIPVVPLNNKYPMWRQNNDSMQEFTKGHTTNSLQTHPQTVYYIQPRSHSFSGKDVWLNSQQVDVTKTLRRNGYLSEKNLNVDEKPSSVYNHGVKDTERWESLKGCDINASGQETSGSEGGKTFGVIGGEKVEKESKKVDFANSLFNSHSTLSLQVSTEIVTSPNGHRDLEIKFYSASPPVSLTAQDKEELKPHC